MLHTESIEKVHKYFTNLEKEEQWLQKKLDAGWLLIKYDEDMNDGTIYTFQQIDYNSQKKAVYKIDFRKFDDNEEYVDYIEIFSENGWHSLSQKGDEKHIFYTISEDASKDIFSDIESFCGREERIIQALFRNGMIYFGLLLMSIYIYVQFDKVFFIGVGLYAVFAMFKSLFSYISHKRSLKSMSIDKV